MFGLGPWELGIILVIVLIIFGAGKLPDIGAGIGKGIKNFKKGMAEAEKSEPEKIEEKKKSKPSDSNSSN
jgi:sec-independent protein translocase protein TatA